MQKIAFLWLLCSFLGIATAAHAQTVVFSENFQSGMPANFTLFDMDGRTPAPSTAYITSAWVARPDFLMPAFTGDSAAFSTSWYSPNGAADDWMITPAITLTSASVLRWQAAAYSADYPDGYEVRIFTAAPTTATLASSTVLFSISAEIPSRTQRQISLAAYTGQTVYIAFRNTTNDGTLLLVDNIEVRTVPANDIALQQRLPRQQYSKIPFQQYQPQADTLQIQNVGLQAVSNPTAMRRISRGNAPTPQNSAPSNSIASLASNAAAELRYAPFVPTLADVYNFEFATPADQNSQNDTLRLSIDLRNSYARHTGSMVRDLGYGEAGAFIGFMVDINSAQDALSVSAYMAAGYLENRVAAVLFATDANGTPTTAVAYTDTLAANNQAAWYTLPFPAPVSLAAGRYLVALIEFNQPLKLGFTQGHFTPATVWASAPSLAWQPLENINANFAVVPMLELQMSPAFDCSLLTASLDSVRPASFALSQDGALGASASGGTAPYLFAWSSGAATAFADSLAVGTYTLTVTDANLCTYTLQAAVPVATSIEPRVGEPAALVRLFPNPAQEILYVDYSSTEDGTWAMYSTSGQLLRTGALPAQSQSYSLPIADLPAGLYVLQILHSQQQERHVFRKE